MKKRNILHALIYTVLTLGALLVFFPFYLTVVSSLKDMSDIFSNFFGLPRHIVFDNFAYVLQRPDYFIALKNSAIITGVAIVAMVFFLLISFRVSNMSLLVVCGILIGYICSAITDFCVTFADDSNIVNLHNWSMGSFSGMSWEHIRIMVIIVGITVVITFGLAKPISAYQMGESYARNMGVNVKVLRIALILLSSLLSACVTAFAGPISFVGIAVPHLIKLATHTAKPIILIPGCFLGGAVITLFCDGIARTVFAPTEISISSVTAVFLVPVVIAAMLRKQRM